MNNEEIFEGCTRLRVQLADWLATLTAQELDTPSLCSGWTVRDVAGHLLAGLQLTTSELWLEVLRQRFNVDRANAALARRVAAQPIGVVLAGLRAEAGRQLKLPVVGVHGPLIDLLVHGGDMRLPLSASMPNEAALVIEALDRLAEGFPGLVPRARLRGVSLVATDAENSWGLGAVVQGELNDLLMATCGRRVTLDCLSGPGVSILTGRL